jgi:hypothetical protein
MEYESAILIHIDLNLILILRENVQKTMKLQQHFTVPINCLTFENN